MLGDSVGADGPEPMCDPLTLLRFYNARGRDVGEAAEMYRKTMAWRAKLPIGEVMDSFGDPGQYRDDGGRETDAGSWTWRPRAGTAEAAVALRHAFFGRLAATSAGAPILCWRAGAADYGGFVREDLVDVMLKAFVAHIEDGLQAARAASVQSRQLVRARLIVDVQGFSVANVQYLPILRRIINLGKSHFPELSASVTVVRAPAFVARLYGVVRPLLPKLLQDKVAILGTDFEGGLAEHSGVEVSALPRFLGGGSSDDEVGLAEPVPVGAGEALRRQMELSSS